MSQGTGVNQETVRRQLTALEDLRALLDRHLPGLDSVIGLQSSAMWTDIPSCSGFGAAYTVDLAKIQRALLGVRWELVRLQAALAESAASLDRVDQDIQDRLDALADRVARIPTPTCEEMLDPIITPPAPPATTPPAPPLAAPPAPPHTAPHSLPVMAPADPWATAPASPTTGSGGHR